MPIISSPGHKEQQTEHTQCGKSHNNQLLFVQVRQNNPFPDSRKFSFAGRSSGATEQASYKKYTEGGGVASVGVRFMLYIREQDNVFPIRGHIRCCKE